MLRLQILLQAVDRLTAPMRAVEARLAAVGAAARRIGQESGATRLAGAMGRVASSAGNAALAIGRVSATAAGLGTGAAIAGGIAFNRTFVRTAADFEDLQNALETTMESTEAAANALRYIDSWAARTPYTINEAATAFRRLTGAGQNAQQSMDSLGDAASGANVPLMQVTEAYLDAVTGQFERLRELGITAQREGDKVRLTYMRNGRQEAEVVNANNQVQVGSTLRAIWNRQYQGAMERRAGSWRGMLSMLEDAWTRFEKAVMDAGVFDWMKGQLRDLLKRIDELAADGTLRAWAEQIAASILVVFNAIRAFLVGTDEEPAGITRLMDALRRIGELVAPVTDYFGTMETALGAIALVLAGPLIGGLAALTGGMAALGVALLATPAGWFAIAAAGLIALAAAITNNWGGLGDWFRQQLSGLLDPLGALERGLTSFRDWAASILTAWQPVAAFFTRLSDGISAVTNAFGAGRSGQAGMDGAPPALGNVQGRQRAANPGAGFYGNDGFWDQVTGQAGAGQSPAAAAAPLRVQTGGQLNIRVEDGRAPQVTGRPANPDERWTINQGPRLVTP